jgi:two-component system, OmpR family, phosphate regulon response regulator PhoB
VSGIPHPHVLVVDDDERVRTLLSWQLESEGFTVRCTANGTDALVCIERDHPNVVVLDLSLPGVAGLDVLRRVREREEAASVAPLPVIILSGRTGEADRITGLDLGADDYLVKPFSPGELAARVRSVLRRAHRVSPTSSSAGLSIDTVTREAFVSGRRVDLTAREFDLLAFLAGNPRQVFTRPQLLRSVWASEESWQSETTVTEHIHRLRGKLEDDPAHPRWLHTVRGVGYRLEP